MKRETVIKGAIEEIYGKIHPSELLFFYELFGRIYQAGVESVQGQPTGIIQVFEPGGTIREFDNIKDICLKYGYTKTYVKDCLDNKKATDRGHCFKYQMQYV